MTAIKFSRQREAVREYLISTTSHPTADTVYEEIRKQYPNVSLGTVYRNLNLLVEQGEAQKLTTEAGGDHYDGNPKPHYHFLCSVCGRMLDLPVEQLEHINVLAQSGFNGIIKSHSLMFYGLCSECKNK